jgi:hypothetical protein
MTELPRSCEYYRFKRMKTGALVRVCDLNGKPCFVNEVDTPMGRSCQLNCTRRIFALEDEQRRTKSPELP